MVKKKGIRKKGATDPALAIYEKGLAALAKNDWDQAVKHFEAAVDESDSLELLERARAHLEAARRAAAGEGGRPDAFTEAVLALNRGDTDRVLEVAGGAAGSGKQRDERFVYLLAAAHAQRGERERALELLAEAIELEPRNRIHALNDPDFEQLQDDPELARLLGG